LLELTGGPGTSVQTQVIPLTPLGRELLTLIPDRNVHEALRGWANGVRCPQIKSATIHFHVDEKSGPLQWLKIEKLWDDIPGSATAKS